MNERPLFTSADVRSLPSTFRLVIAFLIMPAVSALAAAVVFPIVSGEGWYGGGSGVFAFIAAIAAVFVTLAGALPAFLSLRRRGPISFSQTLWAGAALGNAPGALFALMAAVFAVVRIATGTMAQHSAPIMGLLAGALGMILLGTAVGIISAAVFWFFAIRGTNLVE